MDSNSPMQRREWVLRESTSDVCKDFVDALDIHPLTAKILYTRGYRTIELAHEFLEPTLRSMHDPFLMKDMTVAVHELLKAIDRGQKIMVHGDYDVDGTCSVAVLYGFLKDLGTDVSYFIPTRDQDGYGLSMQTVRRFGQDGVGLLITADCGVSNVAEIELARELGMRVIVVDHHQVPEILPPANAILNPLQSDCQFPFKELAAVGVAFNYVVAIRAELRSRGVFEHIPEPDLRYYLDLVAMGTIADVMPLVGENRTLVRLGLNVLSRRKRAGISALMERACVEVGPVSARTISFRLAPRINAAGRMADASICVELFTTRSYRRATVLAEKLDELNRARQDEERGIVEGAFEEAERQIEQGRSVLVVAHETWNRGVLGIVASRVMEKFNRPTFMLGIEDGEAKGSGRSIDGVDLVQVLNHASDLLTTYGGHSAAAGMSIDAALLEEFHDRVDSALVDVMNNEPMPRPTLKLDGRLPLAEMNEALLRDLEKLAPFGAGNPEPILLLEGAEVCNAKIVGDRHLKARFRDGTGTVDGFGFGMGDMVRHLNGNLSLAYVPRYDRGRGRRRLEVRIQDVRIGNFSYDRVENSE